VNLSFLRLVEGMLYRVPSIFTWSPKAVAEAMTGKFWRRAWCPDGILPAGEAADGHAAAGVAQVGVAMGVGADEVAYDPVALGAGFYKDAVPIKAVYDQSSDRAIWGAVLDKQPGRKLSGVSSVHFYEQVRVAALR
jgi:hypothetical protein